jgi:hypothetical protein
MKRNAFAYFIVALIAELGTTYFQKLRTATDVAPGLYYSSFQELLIDRLFVWSIIFLSLSGVWLLISRRTTTV